MGAGLTAACLMVAMVCLTTLILVLSSMRYFRGVDERSKRHELTRKDHEAARDDVASLDKARESEAQARIEEARTERERIALERLRVQRRDFEPDN